MRKFLFFVTLLTLTMWVDGASAASSGIVIRGRVTDASGKPIRGAMVEAKAGTKTVARFSQRDGRYEIALPAGKYDVVVNAFGFAIAKQSKDTSDAKETNFTLTPHVDLARFSGADVETLLPDNTETRTLRANCDGCHTLHTMMRGRGMTAAQILAYMILGRGRSKEDVMSFLPVLTNNGEKNPNAPTGRRVLLRDWCQVALAPQAIASLAELFEKYMGPDSPDFGLDAPPPSLKRIDHTEVSDAVLRSTVREYTLPIPESMPHSMSVDSVRGAAWFGEQGQKSNQIGRFDMATETLQEYPLPTPGSIPNTGAVAKDGVFWMALPGLNPAGISSVDPKTGKVTEYRFFKEKKPGPYTPGTHTISFDLEGNLLVSQLGVPEVWIFNPSTQEFRAIKYPPPAMLSDESLGSYGKIVGQPPDPIRSAPHHIVTDSKGILWFNERDTGRLMSMDPKSGETKEYKPAGLVDPRGVDVDNDDNVWFDSFQTHTLFKLDQKTGKISAYHPPTKNASFYGIKIDHVSGYIWGADSTGDHMTRFDPKTEQWVEYPIPTQDGYPRLFDIDTSTGKVWFTEFASSKIGVLDPGDGVK